MAKKNLWLGMLVMVLVFGMSVVGCDPTSNDSTNGGSGVQKTLIVQNIPANIYAYGSYGGQIGIFSAGTTPQQAMTLTGIVAGADLSNLDIIVVGSGPYTLTIPLYNINDNSRWTGSGTFDIYVVLNGGGGHYYKASSVNITSGTTTVPFNSATEVFP
jgi:hypothetical protein